MRKLVFSLLLAGPLLVAAWSTNPAPPQNSAAPGDLDLRVRRFLEAHRGTWRDMNVPTVDGQKLHDTIVEHKYKSALEIGTSTGYSGIWIAWALAKTGGTLVTIEIDRGRHDEAVAGFRDAGLAKYVDARLGDAHDIVPALKGPFDFVFCDADKDWYKNYLIAVLPKLTPGGCFAAHNVSERRWGRLYGGGEFLQYARSLPSLETSIFSDGAGMSLSYKKPER